MSKARPGFKRVHTFPKGEAVVALTQFNGQMICATSVGVYMMKDGALIPISAAPQAQ